MGHLVLSCKTIAITMGTCTCRIPQPQHACPWEPVRFRNTQEAECGILPSAAQTHLMILALKNMGTPGQRPGYGAYARRRDTNAYIIYIYITSVYLSMYLSIKKIDAISGTYMYIYCIHKHHTHICICKQKCVYKNHMCTRLCEKHMEHVSRM